MKFLVDAQLPRRLSVKLNEWGHEAIHTLDLPGKNFTSDKEIIEISLSQSRVVITKDADFYNSFLQKSEPYKLLYLTVGNISTNYIIELFEKNLPVILLNLENHHVVELGNKNIIAIT